ncbi:diaminopimelate decarboxylase [Catenisphaera adipataccumulans]|uniref:Diaminopimelate decarboxylase n=1 Tax=Catenisphaera adipataccumulans TaxID=700500 RepID=A0A7W8CXQ8_9FIRM|nr:diaminopimelate decarboxylase [Catenisphaera adipataccumulans]MBB5182834.1 diaminopimelate decarboxylase [Catenisphaera adipataccumulans]
MIEIAGMSVKELADTYQTPLMVYDENKLRQKMSDFMHYFQSDTFETGVLYASKAFSCKEILRLANEYGMCLDVVSGGELYTAGQVNFPMERVYFHGNNKSLAEMKMAIEYGVGTIIVDNLQEAQVFNELAKNSDHVIHILLRINPGIDAHTHKYIVTGHVDSKFGVSMLQEEEIVRVIKTFDENEHTVFEGFHAHIGSQIFDKNAFAAEIKKMFGFVKKMEEDHGIVLNTVNLGGGFAATYTDADAPIPLPEVCATILDTAKAQQDERQTHVKKLLIEPGRSIVAEAGSTIYTAGFTKQTPNKNYVFVDGGMADNIRPALYQAAYDADVANKDDQPKTVTYTIAGKCCESGDLLIEGIKLPPCQAGDLIIVYTTGAYGYSMASHYNKLPLPAVVFVKDGKARVVIERESYEHMIALEK